MSSDTPNGITKSVGLATIGFADIFTRNDPDLIILLGDRYEILAAATAALIHRIPIAHIHGGELTEGAIDEAISNNILKDILQKQRAEVCRMILTEYNEELHMKNERKIAIEEGYKEGYDSGFGKAVDEMIDGFIKDGETKEQIIEKLISYFKMDKEKAKEYFDKHLSLIHI